jgi:hypothetical protein
MSVAASTMKPVKELVVSLWQYSRSLPIGATCCVAFQRENSGDGFIEFIIRSVRRVPWWDVIIVKVACQVKRVRWYTVTL